MKISLFRHFSSCNIKNLDKKSCVNCVCFIDVTCYPNVYERCNKFGEKNIVTGKINYELASNCRSNKNLCGIDAKHFVSRHLYN